MLEKVMKQDISVFVQIRGFAINCNQLCFVFSNSIWKLPEVVYCGCVVVVYKKNTGYLSLETGTLKTFLKVFMTKSFYHWKSSDKTFLKNVGQHFGSYSAIMTKLRSFMQHFLNIDKHVMLKTVLYEHLSN